MTSAASDADRLARVALSRLGEPGDPRFAVHTAQMGAPAFHDALLHERDPGSGVLTDVATRLAAMQPERDLELAARLGIRFVVPGDAEWPEQLDGLMEAGEVQRRGGPPLGLWAKGPVRLDRLAGSLAVVGSRSATTYGGDLAAAIGAGVARAGLPVVSGAAFGIDQAAHRGALAVDGLTVAVLACGVDRAYPTAHRSLLDHLAGHGLVVSELPPGSAPTRLRFLARNRLIAALTRGTVVVEAAVRSGALSTANWAGRLNRAVMGVPGPVTSAQSQGVHELVRTGAAMLVTSPEDVLELVGESGAHLVEEPRGPERQRDRLSLRHQQVLDAVPVARPAHVDSISRSAGLSISDTGNALVRLRAVGLVEADGDGWRLAALAHH
ncbi:DNA-processing protein DprA [Nocardioides deserti]|uniref:DNA-protecting protein DprA n=1 Tax=Nocardioides deserti TaxID=1588644 RepID=A0ABR6UCC4_9ACTN|nr:DNA-processing protein DprA [Nocardioides deserti]MBC2962101.1 DNA-protecting protein DprA [Nocardioides deserti]GGO70157.1 DNA protecting protein DprA [Nocardioides deserti]